MEADRVIPIVACVLRSGGEYRPAHVVALRDGVARHLTLPHRFVCMSDVAVPSVECVPLRHNWPGWWSKLELLTLPGPVLTLDLDTIITGSLDDMVFGHRFTMIEHFYHPGERCSGVMAWGPRAGLSSIYSAFYADPERFMCEFTTKHRWGDQAFIHEHAPYEPGTWQAKHPGRVVSFKAHCRPTGRVPPGASIVAFHGTPRPWSMSSAEQSWFTKVAA